MAETLLRYQWVNYLCHPTCICGWAGEPSMSVKVAKAAHKRHVREDCPIGVRR